MDAESQPWFHMKTNITPKAAFTLVEMLVVIVIISLLATALTGAIKGAQRAANATKCQANMKNLHTAVVAYLADRRGTFGWDHDGLFERLNNDEYNTGFMYPRASSYECKEKVWKDGGAVDKFWECHGWVSWIKETGERLDKNGKTPWLSDDPQFETSHAKEYYYPANIDEKMPKAIAEGYLFKYVGKDLSTYRCPEHRHANTGEPVYLAYAMNNWFGSHVNYSVVGARNTSSFSGQIQPSRMALFIEMEDASPEDVKVEGREGVPANARKKDTKIKALAGDSAWDWDENGSEKARFSHRMGKQGAQMYCNVVFVDGHVQAIPNVLEDEEIDEWNGRKTIEDVYKALGEGVF